MANILDNAGQVFLGVMVLAPLVGSVDKNSLAVVILGLGLTLFSWLISWRLTKEASKL